MKFVPWDSSEEGMGFDVGSIVGIHVVAGYIHVPGIHGVEKLRGNRSASQHIIGVVPLGAESIFAFL